MKFAFIIDGDNVVDIVAQKGDLQDIVNYSYNNIYPNIYNLTPSEREFFEERAAIAEYDGKLSRNEAERLAFERIIIRRNNLN